MEARNIKGEVINLNPNTKRFFRPAIYSLIRKNDKILVVQPTWDDKYSLPGGGLEFGETFTEGAKRECAEETNYEIEIINEQPLFIDTSVYSDPPKNSAHQKVNLFFEAIIIREIEDKKKDIDTVDYFWIEENELRPEDFTFFQRDFMKTILDK